MKILLASSSFAGGGITSYAHELINCYSEGNEFCVIVGNDDQNPIVKPGVKVYKQDCSDFSFDNVRRVVRLINDEIRPDVLISSCAKVIALSLPYLSNNIKVITVSHSLKYIEADMAVFNYKYADVVIALSDFNKVYLDKTFGIFDKQKVRVVYNFVRDYPHSQSLLSEKKERRLTNIVFPGGAAASKSPEIVVKVLNRLVDTNLEFRFYWLGDTSVHLIRYVPFFRKRNIQNLVKQDKRVHFTGRVPREEAEAIIANADIFLSPSRREGCPMSLIEAMRVGTIPIVSDYNNANKEIVVDGYNGFVIEHRDIDRFVSVIKDVVANKKRYYSIYDHSVETYSKKLDFEVWKQKMDGIILSSESSHVDRLGKINPKVYKKDYRRFCQMQKRDNFLFIAQEPLPLLFKFQMSLLSR